MKWTTPKWSLKTGYNFKGFFSSKSSCRKAVSLTIPAFPLNVSTRLKPLSEKITCTCGFLWISSILFVLDGEIKKKSPVSLILKAPMYLDRGDPFKPMVDSRAGCSSLASSLAICATFFKALFTNTPFETVPGTSIIVYNTFSAGADKKIKPYAPEKTSLIFS